VRRRSQVYGSHWLLPVRKSLTARQLGFIETYKEQNVTQNETVLGARTLLASRFQVCSRLEHVRTCAYTNSNAAAPLFR
jgi:hypothetical protein